MEKENTSSGSVELGRTKSDQLEEALKTASSSESIGLMLERTPSRKSSRRMTAASPGRSGGGKNTHIRKARSAQMKFELDELNSGAALSRASSASFGLSFSFTGFTLPPDEIADSKPFSDDDIRTGYKKVPSLMLMVRIRDPSVSSHMGSQ
ncbi:ABC transporter G family member 22 [Senna tora]|uniref:ABC transporter G family member 22 n=1 Tax=Senna tora TaxID=362788 RepID=A0A834W395_9FABA|nr:ABC transporter G family member 22 [Senna tora]